MKLLIGCILVFLAVNLTAAQYELKFSPEDNFANPELNSNSTIRSANDLTYYFYTRRHPSNSIKIKSSSVNLLALTDFVGTKDTLFIIHGWKNDNFSAVNTRIREAILSQNDLNLFVVDWGVIASQGYIGAQGSVRRVGEYVAAFVKDLKSLYRLNINKVKFVGHSLGAHIAGNAGAALGGVVDRIVGLDPAGPLFTINNINNRLDPTDAKFVSIIHTNGGLLGFGAPMGHSDYWPNGGKRQPGCGVDIAGSCAHSRAYDYYAESLTSRILFVANKCKSYEEYTSNKCFTGDQSFMGKFQSDYRAKGDYYLTTNNKSPFAKG